MKKLLTAMMICLLLPVVALANAYDMAAAPHQEVLEYIAGYKRGYVLEDYRFMERMSPDTAIAMVEKNGHRILAVYRKQNGEK